MTNRTNADFLQVLLREARKDPFVYLILAECRLIAFEGPGSAAILRGP
jgi:hypothetical protein